MTKKIAKERLYDWKTEILRAINVKIYYINARFLERDVENELDNNAGNNVAIICKQFYAKVINDELNLDRIDDQSVPGDDAGCRSNSRRNCMSATQFSIKSRSENRGRYKQASPIRRLPKITEVSNWFPIYYYRSKIASLKPLGKALTKIFNFCFILNVVIL